ncbi:hypothetical protein EG832_18750 [bacterium]|nr:hypothetical protein [bacterium]
MIDELSLPETTKTVDSLLTQLSDFWQGGSADREDLIQLLKLLTKRGLKEVEAPFLAARQCLLASPETNEEFRAVADFCKKYPDTVSRDVHDDLVSQFLIFASKRSLEQDDDPDWLRQIAWDIEYIGERLNVETDDFTQILIELADEIENERAEQEPPDDDEYDWHSSNSGVDDIQSMFDGLKNDLCDV